MNKYRSIIGALFLSCSSRGKDPGPMYLYHVTEDTAQTHRLAQEMPSLKKQGIKYLAIDSDPCREIGELTESTLICEFISRRVTPEAFKTQSELLEQACNCVGPYRKVGTILKTAQELNLEIKVIGYETWNMRQQTMYDNLQREIFTQNPNAGVLVILQKDPPDAPEFTPREQVPLETLLQNSFGTRVQKKVYNEEEKK